MSSHNSMYIDRRLPTSKAFLALTSPAAIKVLFVFFTKRQVAKVPQKKRRKQYAITNNGEIVFTYEEAKAKLGITGSTFNRALDQLVAVGFVDIARTGMGVHKVTTLYSLPDRWVKYGTPEFKPKKRAKASNLGVGFKKGNTLWQRAQKKVTATSEHGATRIGQHGGILAMRTDKHGKIIRTLYKLQDNKWLARQIA